MTCQQAQLDLSLYLYGELDFAQEDEFERHLAECALCQRALAREKSWHTTVNAERRDVPLDLLAQCRRDLRTAVSAQTGHPRSSLMSWLDAFGFSSPRWSMRVAAASFLVVIGFGAGRWVDRNSTAGVSLGNSSEMGFIGPSTAHIRDIQPSDNDRVRIVFDQVRPREIIGRVNESEIRQLLLAAITDPADPGIRVDSVEMLNGQSGEDVREALIYSVRHDPNAAVRLKALEGLGRFSGDKSARETLRFALEHDENPGVRSEAIDILAPVNQPLRFNPDLASTLQQIVRSGREDDYVRLRSMQLLREMKASLDVY